MTSSSARLDLREIEAFLFDLDGVVTRTAGIHAMAWKQLFDDFLERRARMEGTRFLPFDPVEDYKKYVDGRPREEGVKTFLEARKVVLPVGTPEDGVEVETVNGLGKRKDVYFLENLARHGVDICDGAIEFIENSRTRGVRTAVVSSSQNCAAVLVKAGITGLFDVRVDGVDRRQSGLLGKPAPDMYLEAARRLGTPPARAVVFEDAFVGVEAGRAGKFLFVVGIGRGRHAIELEAHGADIVIAGLRELSLDNYAHGYERR